MIKEIEAGIDHLQNILTFKKRIEDKGYKTDRICLLYYGFICDEIGEFNTLYVFVLSSKYSLERLNVPSYMKETLDTLETRVNIMLNTLKENLKQQNGSRVS